MMTAEEIKDLSRAVDGLVAYAIREKLLQHADEIWARNTLLNLVTADSYIPSDNAPTGSVDQLLNAFVDAAEKACGMECGPEATERFVCEVMNELMPRPSEVNDVFHYLLERSSAMDATNYLYDLSCKAAYVKEAAIARNISWVTKTKWGELEITINLSKPEKDPRAIAALASKKAAADAGAVADAGAGISNAEAASPDGTEAATPPTYPACQLCADNVGVAGRFSDNPLGFHPARQNLRIVDIELGGQKWGLQYSPYAYYHQHCIVLNHQHIPMHIDAEAFTNLLEFTDRFPHYMIGSNADLPIVGGSILNHDHYQAGMHVFPMEMAEALWDFNIPGAPYVRGTIVQWPLTVLRLQSESRDDLVKAATHVLDVWRGYTDESAGIFAETEGTPHNTITPIARCSKARGTQTYTLNLVLRNNRTDEDHPLGIFHPSNDLHHIKKENIGLIEVMGLAILPARLKTEMAAVKEALLQGQIVEQMRANELTASHAEWAADLRKRHPEFNASNAEEILRTEIADVFCKVLECAGVFKWNVEGRTALQRFLAAL